MNVNPTIYIYANIYVHKDNHDMKHVLVDCCISAQQIKAASQFIKTDVLEYNQPLIAGSGNLYFAAKSGAS